LATFLLRCISYSDIYAELVELEKQDYTRRGVHLEGCVFGKVVAGEATEAEAEAVSSRRQENIT